MPARELQRQRVRLLPAMDQAHRYAGDALLAENQSYSSILTYYLQSNKKENGSLASGELHVPQWTCGCIDFLDCFYLSYTLSFKRLYMKCKVYVKIYSLLMCFSLAEDAIKQGNEREDEQDKCDKGPKLRWINGQHSQIWRYLPYHGERQKEDQRPQKRIQSSACSCSNHGGCRRRWMFCCAGGWARSEKEAKEECNDAREQAEEQYKHADQEGKRERLLVDKENYAAHPVEHNPDEGGDNGALTHESLVIYASAIVTTGFVIVKPFLPALPVLFDHLVIFPKPGHFLLSPHRLTLLCSLCFLDKKDKT
jgi:hypothetical protein